MASDLLFDDEPIVSTSSMLPPWVVMIVDDDHGIHDVTQLVMSGFEFDGRKLMFISCYSASEAREVLQTRRDIALILLDVVMETEHAGLGLARYIREDLQNLNVRIVLRTGQAGQAPEEQVIKAYDINDYKEKTELTHGKLMTVFYSSLRSYRDLIRIARARDGLKRAINAITSVYDSKNLRTFASAVLEQAGILLGISGEGVCATKIAAYTASSGEGHLKVLAATDAYSRLHVDEEVSDLPQEVRDAFELAFRCKGNHSDSYSFTGYYNSSIGNESVIYMTFSEPLVPDVKELLELFIVNVAITYESLLLREEIEETQRSTIFIIGEAVEKRSKETGAHVRRVGEISALLAHAIGMTEREVDALRQAAPLHDVGKIGIPDAVLNKPGKLDAEEWEVMKTHSRIGFELLNKSEKRVLQLGAIIAHEHHERWDGKGYPRALKGEQIHIAGRISALADVLDALVSKRCYKPAWSLPEALQYIADERGKHFDPQLVDQLQAHLPQLENIYQSYPDEV